VPSDGPRRRIGNFVTDRTVSSGYSRLEIPPTISKHLNPEAHMLHWALMFLVVAIVAAILGFGGVAVAAAGIAKLIFVIFLVLFLVSLITHLGRRRSV
jgi:uncharacterized membrane protein YtjA (UPF0391 family)